MRWPRVTRQSTSSAAAKACSIGQNRIQGRSRHGQNPRAYTLYNGRPLCEQVNVAWALHDAVMSRVNETEQRNFFTILPSKVSISHEP